MCQAFPPLPDASLVHIARLSRSGATRSDVARYNADMSQMAFNEKNLRVRPQAPKRTLARKLVSWGIEFIVVIAVIGAVSLIILVSLHTARAKARDAVVRAKVQQFAVLMELEHADAGSYANLQRGSMPPCRGFSGSNASTATRLCQDIVDTGSTLHTGNGVDNANRYSVMARLSGRGTYLCLGSSGGTSDTEIGDDWLDAGCYANP